jgi:hypothetical protein
MGGVSNVDIDGNNSLYINTLGAAISTFETRPIFILSGQMEIGIGDGTTRRFGPGDVVLADDRTGKGHTTRSLGVPRVSATVAVAE